MSKLDVLTSPQVVFPALRVMAKRDWTSRLLTRSLAPFNPLDPRRYVDPYPMYEEVRAHGPMFYHRRLDGWIFTGFAECEEVLRANVSVDRSQVMDVVSPYKDVASETMDVFRSMLLTVDPPRHGRLRSLVSRAFTPRAVARLEPRINDVTSELLDRLPDLAKGSGGPDHHVDVMEHFASQLPIYVIGELLGLPRDHRNRLKELSDVTARFVDPLTGFDPDEMSRSVSELQSIFDVEIERRRQSPSDDMLSALVEAEEDGDRLSNTELHSMILLLMVAGHETTTGLIGNALYWLDQNREARTLFLESPELAQNAVEEFLRFDSPVQATDRIAVEDFVVNGISITKGSSLTTLLGAANRDPRIFDRPNELLLDRHEPRSLSFGHGIHHCIGAALARLETRVALSSFVARFPDYGVNGDGLRWKRSITLRGPSTLPIKLQSS